MRKLTITDADVIRLAVQQEIARSEESRYDHRLHGILLVSHGLGCSQVAEWLGQHPVTIQRWVTRFETAGFAGLQEGDRPGPRPRQSPGVASGAMTLHEGQTAASWSSSEAYGL